MDAIVQLLEGLNAVAATVGGWLLAAVGLILPGVVPSELAAPVGWLVALTAVLALTEVARKLTWVIVGIGWLLLAVRVVMVVLQA
ncbi:MAG: hypothetical protein ACREKG_00860 [Candidatus Rokuibacteriota bacterium]